MTSVSAFCLSKIESLNNPESQILYLNQKLAKGSTNTWQLYPVEQREHEFQIRSLTTSWKPPS